MKTRTFKQWVSYLGSKELARIVNRAARKNAAKPGATKRINDKRAKLKARAERRERNAD